MAIEIRESFEVSAPVEVVWRFVMDPESVVSCMPGAELDEVVDERTFLGSVQVRLGAVTARYQGRVQFTVVDAQRHRVQMVAEGRESGGGTARGTVTSRLRALPEGGTEVVAEAELDLTGRIVQVGRGLIQGVSRQLFRQFAERTRKHLEASSSPATLAARPAESAPLRIFPLILRALWSPLERLLRRWRRPPAL